jgi:hypothetical protein
MAMSNNQVDRNPFIPSLRTSALRLCIINANNFVSLGDLPFVLVKPILQACSATQLALLEDQSPHLREDTQEIWQRHITERFRCQGEKRENEDYRDVYERLKTDESERLKHATARLRAKNGKIKEEKLAKQIVVIDPKKTPVKGDRKRPHPFSSNSSYFTQLIKVHGSPQQKKNPLMEKARRDTSKMNYASAPKFSMTRPTGLTRPGGLRMSQNGISKPRREPAPANDNNVFGRQPDRVTSL